MKIYGVIKDCMNKFSGILHTCPDYHKYKYTTSVHIDTDVSKVLKGVKRAPKTVVAKRVVQKVH